MAILFSRNFPTKLLLFSWWIFLFFMVNSYQANLAAVFTTSLMESNINTAGDLLEIPGMKFGCVKGASFNILQVLSKETYLCTYQLLIFIQN